MLVTHSNSLGLVAQSVLTPAPLGAAFSTPKFCDIGALFFRHKIWTFALCFALGSFGSNGSEAGPLGMSPEQTALLQSDGLTDGFDIIEAASETSDNLLPVPVPGRIVKWELYFQYTTQCENDHFASLTSPGGRKLILMDRGLHRCSGERSTFTGSSDSSSGAFLGLRAKGNWKFMMVDLDENAFSGTLDEVWINFTMKDKGIVTEHKVSLSGLPQPIASGKP